MSKFEFKLPDIGEGVAEGEIVNWLVNEGDSVSENQEMVEVMTDKATVTIGAPKTGKVTERRFKVGETVPVGRGARGWWCRRGCRVRCQARGRRQARA
jgi:pyruvate dehydrogenase E2 component (dihydrolipoamide acetyltransferase)